MFDYNKFKRNRLVLIGMLTEQGANFVRVSWDENPCVRFVAESMDDLNGVELLEDLGYTVMKRYAFKNIRGAFTENIIVSFNHTDGETLAKREADYLAIVAEAEARQAD